MNLSVGIVGLPNVGKSTLFNALLKKQQALVANYPFATIEPNVGVVPVPDNRLEVLADIVAKEILKQVQDDNKKKPPIVPATVRFVDIAGLVKGASEGAGLGNKFLSHIREVSVIAHVVRVFEDPSAGSGQVPIIREGAVDPRTDYETINTELVLADLQSIENLKRKAKSEKLQLKNKNELIERVQKSLNEGVPVRNLEFSKEEREVVNQLFLLTSKPEIVVLNVSEQALNQAEEITQNYAEELGVPKEKFTVISAQIEAELAELSEEEQIQYLKDLGLEQSGLERLIKKAYETLGLISFLTAGEKEVRAWTLRRGETALRASSVIHTDFEKNFIKAEVVKFEDFVQNIGWKGAREKGKARMEGKDYIMQDGDVVEFKIGR